MLDEQPIQVAVFDRLQAADRAVGALADAGVSPDRISVVCPTAPATAFEGVERVEPAGESASTFAVAGGAIGTVVAGLTATAGIIATGGTGFLAAGPILGAAAAGGATGSFLGLMSTRGLAPEIADYYDQALQRGQVLVGVDPAEGAGPSMDEARRILAEHGGDTKRLPDAS